MVRALLKSRLSRREGKLRYRAENADGVVDRADAIAAPSRRPLWVISGH